MIIPGYDFDFPLEEGKKIFHSHIRNATIDEIIFNEDGSIKYIMIKDEARNTVFPHAYSDIGKNIFINQGHVNKKFSMPEEYFEYIALENKRLLDEEKAREERKILEEEKKKKEAAEREKLELQRKQELKRIREIEKQRAINEAKKEKRRKEKIYKELLEKINSANPAYTFEGLIHVTELDNLTGYRDINGIIRDGFLGNRSVVLSFKDKANQDIIRNTKSYVKSCTRFYYRPGTPTHNTAGYDKPVILVFDPKIMLEDNAAFCNGNAGSSQVVISKDIEFALSLDWREILRRDMMYYDEDHRELTFLRNCEFLYFGTVSLKYLKKIYFRDEKTYKLAKRRLGKELSKYECEIRRAEFSNVSHSIY